MRIRKPTPLEIELNELKEARYEAAYLDQYPNSEVLSAIDDEMFEIKSRMKPNYKMCSNSF